MLWVKCKKKYLKNFMFFNFLYFTWKKLIASSIFLHIITKYGTEENIYSKDYLKHISHGILFFEWSILINYLKTKKYKKSFNSYS